MSNLLSSRLSESLGSQCFLEFPSGNGSWNDGDDFDENGDLINKDELLQLIHSKNSPWKTENKLSNEVILIKEELIRNGGCKSLNYIKKSISSLRLLDKNITTVDMGLRAMTNIKELILSANQISNIDAECLPKKLTVLELFSNLLQSVEFCSDRGMPSLEHFGVGANRIKDISPLLASVLMTSLVSLDLGRNSLTNLASTTSTISQLQSIKILVLAGNPLSLLAVYRAYLIDSISSLTCLDDILITADERFSVKNMKTIPDNLKKLCKWKISILSINNIPAKEVPENAPEEPVIKTEFYLKFWFPFQKTNLETIHEEGDKIKDENLSDSEIDVLFMHKSECMARLTPEIIFNWTEDISINNVGKFCYFLDDPLRITIMEETKYLYSPENLPSKSPSRMDSQSSKRRDQTKSANKHAGKDNKPKKDTGKKKKVDESKLVVNSKHIRRFAECLLNISKIKEGVVTMDEILKTNIIHQSDTIDNTSKSKKPQDIKSKKSSAKERLKSPDKSNTKKGRKTPTAVCDENEQIVPVECHVVVDLLTIKNLRSIDNY